VADARVRLPSLVDTSGEVAMTFIKQFLLFLLLLGIVAGGVGLAIGATWLEDRIMKRHNKHERS
jgi:hypothetical protein